MSKFTQGFTIGAFLGICFTCIIAVPIAITNTNNAWRNDAVGRNAAEYYLDEHQERQWRWKDQATPAPTK